MVHLSTTTGFPDLPKRLPTQSKVILQSVLAGIGVTDMARALETFLPEFMKNPE
jgi:hypothetical protein